MGGKFRAVVTLKGDETFWELKKQNKTHARLVLIHAIPLSSFGAQLSRAE